MKKTFALLHLLLLLPALAGRAAPFGSAFTYPITPGNLIVERVGNGNGLTSGGTPVWLHEFTPNGVLVQMLGLPGAFPRPTAPPFNLVDSGNDYHDGYLTRSADGRLISVPGYNGTNGGPDVTLTSTSQVLRVVGVLDAEGTVDTSRAAGMYSFRNIHSVTTKDGTGFWATGEQRVEGPGGLVYYQPNVATNSLLNATLRCVRIFNEQLYVSSSQSGAAGSIGIGVFAIGSGLPTSGTPRVTPVITVGGAVPQPVAFEFNPAFTVAYVAKDSSGAADVGIVRYTHNGAGWSSNYTLGTGLANVGARGLTVDWSGPDPVIYATTGEVTTRLVRIVDTNSAARATTIATAPLNQAFRGVALAPIEPIVPTILSQQERIDGSFQMTFSARFTQTYRVLASERVELPPATWVVLSAGMFGPGPVTFVDADTVNHPRRFYRIVSP